MFETLTRQIGEVRSALADCPRDLSDAERVDLIRALEELKCTAAAAQATTAVDLDERQRAIQVAAGLRAERVGEGIAEQVGLALRESPHKAARLLGLAKVLEREMPHTLALMRAGRLNEWRATILARETACLSAEHRAIVDLRLCSGGGAATMSDLGLARAAKKLACELDVASVAARAQGDERTKGQVMADTLVERVTGTPAPETPRVEVKIVMTDRSFFHSADDAAHLAGYGPVPAPWARAFVKDAMRVSRLWIRRLYVAPKTGELVGLDSRSRLAPAALADFIDTRDQDLCRTPWCGAPIRQTDHAKAWEDGGRTRAANLQGLCQRCNLAKQAPGWTASTVWGPGRYTTETTTPTGHRHRSRSPAPPGQVDVFSPLDRAVYELIA